MTDTTHLHLVFGGELKHIDSEKCELRDLKKIDVVGFYPNYASALVAWKSASQQSIDNAHMRYFIVHLHKYIDIFDV